MSRGLLLGFGDGALGGVVRSDGGGLIYGGGEAVRSLGPRVRTLEESVGWRASTDDGLDVAFEPLGEPATFPDGTREWLCRARGSLNDAQIDCFGHAVAEAEPPRGWKRAELARVVVAWMGEDLAVSLRARRPSRVKNHGAEELAGFVLSAAGVAPEAIADPRLSTAYGADGRQRRAGLELWETEESDYPLRFAGEAIGDGELALQGGTRLRCAFFLWRQGGRVGAGRYDIVLSRDGPVPG